MVDSDSISKNIEDDCYIEEALEGLAKLGAAEHHNMLEKVVEYRDKHSEEIAKAENWNEYIKIMSDIPFDQKNESIDFRFIRMNPELYKMRRKYIMQHLDVFAPRP